jgi:hypothetical protein
LRRAQHHIAVFGAENFHRVAIKTKVFRNANRLAAAALEDFG